MMQYNKNKQNAKISDIIGEHSINNKKYRSHSTATGVPVEKQESDDINNLSSKVPDFISCIFVTDNR